MATSQSKLVPWLIALGVSVVVVLFVGTCLVYYRRLRQENGFTLDGLGSEESLGGSSAIKRPPEAHVEPFRSATHTYSRVHCHTAPGQAATTSPSQSAAAGSQLHRTSSAEALHVAVLGSDSRYWFEFNGFNPMHVMSKDGNFVVHFHRISTLQSITQDTELPSRTGSKVEIEENNQVLAVGTGGGTVIDGIIHLLEYDDMIAVPQERAMYVADMYSALKRLIPKILHQRAKSTGSWSEIAASNSEHALSSRKEKGMARRGSSGTLGCNEFCNLCEMAKMIDY
ncbi:hypothetical protein B0T10DRAFT_496069 [Thelonectria olida]|uniref:Uncharacterized protein n=1 Tax=Thelonectria olida TaxID=1576542 RepID=A0A9P9AH83_9HYPO|nr:hypothetical protein B0T10DRAFT_496069 [Thelonectria olida]